MPFPCPALLLPRGAGVRLRRSLLLVVVALAAPAPAQGAARPAAPPAFARVASTGFAIGGTMMPYLHGINYEGPADQAWHMWDSSTFSPSLIAADFDRAVQAGYDPIRLFVQAPLVDEVLAGDFSRLDTVVALARARGLHLLLAFNDAHDTDLTRVAHIDGLIAAHLAGEPAIFGYDVENEPGLRQIAAATYPAGVAVPLQGAAGAALIAHYAAPPPRGTGVPGPAPTLPSGESAPPSVSAAVDSLLARFQAENPIYPVEHAGPAWQPFLDACNGSLAAYLQTQVGALRAADPHHIVTVGYNSPFWASLPANAMLDFRSLHLYPSPGDASIGASAETFAAVRASAASPLVLEEYGFSTAGQSPQAAAVQETALQLSTRLRGSAGDLKWMLNDVPNGTSPVENALGVFDAAGQPKPALVASRAASLLFNAADRQNTLALTPDAASGVAFLLAGKEGLATSRSTYADGRLRYAVSDGAAGQVWLSWATPGHVRIMATSPATMTLNLRALAGAASAAPRGVSPPTLSWAAQGSWLDLTLPAGVVVDVAYRVPPPPAPPGGILAVPRTRRAALRSVAARQRFLSRFHALVVVSAPALRLRAGPDLRARLLGVVTQRDRLALLGHAGSWRHVAVAPGLSGWVYGAYVTAVDGSPVLSHTMPLSATVSPASAPARRAAARGPGQPAVLLADWVRVRSGPRLGAHPLFFAFRGRALAVLAVHVSWVKVAFADGRTGWMLSHYVRMSPAGARRRAVAPPAASVYVWATALYVRAAPRLGGRIMDIVGLNAALRVIGTHVSWSRVRLPGGKAGWVLTHYIKAHPRPRP